MTSPVHSQLTLTRYSQQLLIQRHKKENLGGSGEKKQKTQLEREMKRLIDDNVRARVISRQIRNKMDQAEKREKFYTEQKVAALNEKLKMFEDKRRQFKEASEQLVKGREEKLKKLTENIEIKVKNKEKLEEERKFQMHEKQLQYVAKIQAIKEHKSAASVEEDQKRFARLEELEKDCTFIVCTVQQWRIGRRSMRIRQVRPAPGCKQ
eukprot:TRINITY_DN54_c0_g1_i1.p4 TRINITY_DN54_c0_g1~~TRINITY_DN54_c0_g1_i1.p4  ORF type:complete len:208 (+),score=34.39 TRINITY_DN54_c0_g1_i1:449-1072(+)